MLCMLKNCSKCAGDLVLEDRDWRCVQCGKYYYGDTADPLMTIRPGQLSADAQAATRNGSARLDSRPTALLDTAPAAHTEKAAPRGQREGYRPRSPRNLNSLVEAKAAGEAKWWERNKQVIDYLEQGLSVGAISLLTARGPRQIRIVRERLADLRETDWQEA